MNAKAVIEKLLKEETYPLRAKFRRHALSILDQAARRNGYTRGEGASWTKQINPKTSAVVNLQSGEHGGYCFLRGMHVGSDGQIGERFYLEPNDQLNYDTPENFGDSLERLNTGASDFFEQVSGR